MDLADSFPNHTGQRWVRIRASVLSPDQMAGGVAVRHQTRGESDLHANPVWDAELWRWRQWTSSSFGRQLRRTTSPCGGITANVEEIAGVKNDDQST